METDLVNSLLGSLFRHASLTPPPALIHLIICSLITKSLFWPKHQHWFHRQRNHQASISSTKTGFLFAQSLNLLNQKYSSSPMITKQRVRKAIEKHATCILTVTTKWLLHTITVRLPNVFEMLMISAISNIIHATVNWIIRFRYWSI